MKSLAGSAKMQTADGLAQVLALLFVCVCVSRVAQGQPIIIDPGAPIHAVVPHDFDHDGTTDLLVSIGGSQADPESRVAVYSWHGPSNSFRETQRYPVPADAVAFTAADFLGAGRSQLMLLTGRSAFVFESPDADPVRLLSSTNFIFTMPRRDRLPFWDYAGDLNADGRDDLILAGDHGYRVFLQTPNGTLAESGYVEGDYSFSTRGLQRRRRTGRTYGINIGIDDPSEARQEREQRADARRGGSPRRDGSIVTSRRLGRLALADANADGRTDLITLKHGNIRTHFQREDGSFADAPDAVYSLGPQGSGPGWNRDVVSVTHGDVNRDGRVDFVVSEIKPRELATVLRLYLWGDAGISTEPTQIIKLHGLAERAELEDVNGDGFLDLVCTVFRADKMLSLRSASTEEIEVALTVHVYEADSEMFSRRATIAWESALTVTEDMGDSQELILLEGDFNGDGVLDLIVHLNQGEAHVYEISARGKTGLKLRSKPIHTWTTALPSLMRVFDANSDGKSDALFRHQDTLEIFITP